LSNFFDYRYLNILSDGPQVGPVAFSVPSTLLLVHFGPWGSAPASGS